MGYIVVNNFKAGLDRRRDQMSSVPGVLEVAENGHINQGGEFEKRKAFTRIAVPAGTFGLEATNASLVVFGSGAAPGGLPAGVIYQRLDSPTGSAMTEIVHSSTFGGKIFAIAKYLDGKTFCFYDGTLVYDQYLGHLLGSNANLGNQINGAIGISGFYTAVGSGVGPIDIYSEPGGSYAVSIVHNSVLGTLTEQKVSGSIAGTPAQVAVGSFRIFAGSEAGGNQITQIAVDATNLLAAPVPFNDSIEQTAADIATAINAGASIYNATAEAGKISIFADTSGATPNSKAVIVTSAGNVCVGNCIFSIFGTDFKLNYIRVNGGANLLTAVQDFNPGGNLTTFCAAVVANINGGTGGHGYLAYAASNVIFLSKAVTSSADTSFDVEVEVVPDPGGSGTVVAGTTEPLLISVNKRNVVFSFFASGGLFTWTSDVVTVGVTGGVPPYRYEWPAFFGGMKSTTPNSPSTQFVYSVILRFGARPPPSEIFEISCKVTDALGRTGESAKVVVVRPTL